MLVLGSNFLFVPLFVLLSTATGFFGGSGTRGSGMGRTVDRFASPNDANRPATNLQMSTPAAENPLFAHISQDSELKDFALFLRNNSPSTIEMMASGKPLTILAPTKEAYGKIDSKTRDKVGFFRSHIASYPTQLYHTQLSSSRAAMQRSNTATQLRNDTAKQLHCCTAPHTT
jgi:hypothetical protein